jgi:hypothetical protein
MHLKYFLKFSFKVKMIFRCPRIFAPPPHIFAPQGVKFLGISTPQGGENPRNFAPL